MAERFSPKPRTVSGGMGSYSSNALQSWKTWRFAPESWWQVSSWGMARLKALSVTWAVSPSDRTDHAWKLVSNVKAAATYADSSPNWVESVVDLSIKWSTWACAAAGGHPLPQFLGGTFVACVLCDSGRCIFHRPRHQSGYCPCLAPVYAMHSAVSCPGFLVQ